MEIKKCFFTNAEIKYENIQGLHVIKEGPCGLYWIDPFLIHTRNDVFAKNELVQGHANCARKNIETLANEKIIPVWTSRDKVDDMRKSLSNATKKVGRYIVLSFEDEYEKPVDHSLKPMELLKSFSARLSTNKAYSKFVPSPKDMLSVGIVNVEELFRLLHHLTTQEMVQYDQHSDAIKRGLDNPKVIDKILSSPVHITPKGWAAVREANELSNSNKVFIATAFEWDKDYPCKREDATEAIKRACDRLGYKADTVGQYHTESITDKIISEIRDSAFVVCELTHHNRGAYYESGFARGLGKKVFHVFHNDFCKTDKEADKDNKRIHFDIQQIMYRKWNDPQDLEDKLFDWISARIGRYGKKLKYG